MSPGLSGKIFTLLKNIQKQVKAKAIFQDKDLASIKKWKQNSEHREAQTLGRKQWYEAFKVRIALVERDYGLDI